MATTTTQPKAKNAKLRQAMFDMLMAGEDPGFVRFAFGMSGGADLEEIDSTIADFQSIVSGKPIEKKLETIGGKEYEVSNTISATEAATLKEKEILRDSVKKNAVRDLSEKATALTTLATDEEGIASSVGTGIAGRGVNLPGGVYTDPNRSRFTGQVSKLLSTETLDTLINAKAEGATFGALSEGELALLKSSASVLNKWAIQDENGNITGFNVSEEDFKKELENYKALTQKALEAITQEEAPKAPVSGTSPAAETTSRFSGDQASFQAAMQMAQRNPDDPNSKLFLEAVNSGKIDPETGRIKSLEVDPSAASGSLTGTLNPAPDLTETPHTNPDGSLKTQGFFSNLEDQEVKPDAFETAGKVGRATGAVFGGDVVGNAIGNVIGGLTAKYGEAGEMFKNNISTIEKQFQEGKITQEQRDKLMNVQESGMREAFGYDGPGLKQLAGDVAYMALTFIPMAKAAQGASLGTKTAVAATNLGKAVATGVAKAAAEDKDMVSGGVKSGIGYAVVTSAFKGAGALANLFGYVGKKTGAALSGLGDDVVDEIIANPKLARQGMGGKPGEVITQNTKEVIGLLDDYIKTTGKNYSDEMAQVGDIAVDNRAGKKTLTDGVLSLLTSRGVEKTKTGLNFDESRFVETGDMNRIQKAWGEVNKAKDMSPKSLNLLKQRIRELRKSDTPENKVVNGVIDGIVGKVDDLMSSFGDEISSINKTYSDRTDLANAIRRELANIGSLKKVSRTDLLDAEKRLGTLFTKNKEGVRALFKELGAGDVVGRQAGAEVNRVGSGQSSKISDAAMNVIRSIGLPKMMGQGAAAYGDIKRIVGKVTEGKGLDDAERRILSRILAIFGQ